MKEQTTTRSGIFAGVPEGRCIEGAKSDNPCPRKATEYRWPHDTEPTLCREHARLAELTDEADDLRIALDQLHEWIQATPKHHDALIHAVYDQRDVLERRYLEALTRERGAELIADGRARGGQREYPNVSPEQAEEVALAMMRGDAFNDARAILEDLPEEAFGATRDRWVLCAILEAAHEAASAEYRRISAEVWPSGADEE